MTTEALLPLLYVLTGGGLLALGGWAGWTARAQVAAATARAEDEEDKRQASELDAATKRGDAHEDMAKRVAGELRPVAPGRSGLELQQSLPDHVTGDGRGAGSAAGAPEAGDGDSPGRGA